MTASEAIAYAHSELSARSARAYELEKRREERIYSEHPRLVELERELGAATTDAIDAMLKGRIPAGEANRLISAAAHRRDEYKKQNGIEDINFHFCHVCNDSGYVKDERCVCLKRLVRDYCAHAINEASPFELCGFDSFSLDYYPRERINGVAPYSLMKKNLERCQAFAKNTSGGSLLLTGGAGLGKTHLALSIARELLDAGADVIYCSAANIFKQIEAEYFDGRGSEILDSLKDCTVLILDDLGSEYLTPFIVSTIYDLVNTRASTGKSTVYTTNITKTDLLEVRYGEPVASRLIGCCEVLPFVGEDIRGKKNA